MEINDKDDSLMQKLRWLVFKELTFWQIKTNLMLNNILIDKKSLWKRLKRIKKK